MRNFIFSIKGFTLLIIVLLSYYMLSIITLTVVVDLQFIKSALPTIETEQIKRIYSFLNSNVFLICFIPIAFIFFRLIITTIVLLIGSFMLDLKVAFKLMFKLVVTGEFIFLTREIIILSLGLAEEKTDISFSLFSLISNRLSENYSWLSYFAQLINLYLITYLVIISILIHIVFRDIETIKSFKLVFASLGTSIIIWALFVSIMNLYVYSI